jgi:F-type H+-transporting ATPase subunit gamma
MCGPFNDTIVSHALEALGVEREEIHLIAVGIRAGNRLEEAGRRPRKTFSVPGSVGAVTPLVQDLVLEIESWVNEAEIGRVFLFHCAPQSGASYHPRRVRLLPLDREWLREIRKKPWPGNQLPWFSMDWDTLFGALVRQYLFVSLFRAAAESLAAENASRLAAMQGAESSIEDRLEVLRGQYHRERQTGITEELLDIVSGFEALQAGGPHRQGR